MLQCESQPLKWWLSLRCLYLVCLLLFLVDRIDFGEGSNKLSSCQRPPVKLKRITTLTTFLHSSSKILKYMTWNTWHETRILNPYLLYSSFSEDLSHNSVDVSRSIAVCDFGQRANVQSISKMATTFGDRDLPYHYMSEWAPRHVITRRSPLEHELVGVRAIH